jgi:hypothetical protein
MIIASGKRGTSARGLPTQNNLLLFPFWFGVRRGAKPKRKKEVGLGGFLTQGGGLSGLVLSYYVAARP